MGLDQELAELDKVDEAASPRRYVIMDTAQHSCAFMVQDDTKTISPMICDSAEDVINLLYGPNIDPMSRARFIPVKVPDALIDQLTEVAEYMTSEWRRTGDIPVNTTIKNLTAQVRDSIKQMPALNSMDVDMFDIMMNYKGPMN